jgi:coenzyme Q-binding protein COQ10
MFDLVSDIESYPEFLPWVTAARTLRKDGDVALYELAVGFKMVRERFTSRVRARRPDVIEVEYIRGPLRHLKNRWEFVAIESGGCEIDFFIEFEFKSVLMQKLIGTLFHDAVTRMVRAFEVRARQIYGDREPGAGTKMVPA